MTSEHLNDMNQRRLSRDPHYVNRAVADGRPDATTDARGARVVPVEPPYNQPPPADEVSDQGDTWIEAAGLEKPSDVPEPKRARAARSTEQPKAPIGDDTDKGPAVKSEAEVQGLKQSELVEYADAHGVDASGTKAQIVERLRAAGKVGA